MPTALRANGRASRLNGRGVTSEGGASCCCDGGITPIKPEPCDLCSCESPGEIRCVTQPIPGSCVNPPNANCLYFREHAGRTDANFVEDNDFVVFHELPVLEYQINHAVTARTVTRRLEPPCDANTLATRTTFSPALTPSHPRRLTVIEVSQDHAVRIDKCPFETVDFDPFENTVAGSIIYAPGFATGVGSVASPIPQRQLVRHLVEFTGTSWANRSYYENGSPIGGGFHGRLGVEFFGASDMLTGESIWVLFFISPRLLQLPDGSWSASALSVPLVDVRCVQGMALSFSARWYRGVLIGGANFRNNGFAWSEGSISGTVLGIAAGLRGCDDGESPSAGCTNCGGLAEGVAL